jgi:S1-C subfamily serine protease
VAQAQVLDRVRGHHRADHALPRAGRRPGARGALPARRGPGASGGSRAGEAGRRGPEQGDRGHPGRSNGFRIYAIKPNTFYAQIGIQNGDTVRAINGHEMTSPDRALEVYTKLRSANRLSMSLLRGGKDLTIDYDIVNR